MEDRNFPFSSITFSVKPWGIVNTGELWNAVFAANAAQDCFIFNPDYEALPLNPDHYRLADGGLDLDKAVKDLTRQKYFKQLAYNNLILVTAAPYSEPGAVLVVLTGVNLPGYFYETDVLGDRRVSIISTYLWDNLPLRLDLKVLKPTGRRALQPYLLLAFATIALDKLIKVETHYETLACPNDYCDNVVDIDAFFERGKWFCEQFCNPVIRKALGDGKFHVGQLKAIKRILNRARGEPPNDGYDSCFISYGRPDKIFAKRLYDDLKARNIECWIYDVDSKAGERTMPNIHTERRFADRVLIICSSVSLKREGVLEELKMQIDENPDKIIPISVDTEWLSEEFHIYRGPVDMKSFLCERNYADFVTQSYNKALKRLVAALHWR